MVLFFRQKQKSKLNREEYEFLPAALEIVETPSSPAGRLLMWLIMAFFVIALIWAIWAQVDEVAVAKGKVIPAGYTKMVQAEDKGIVRKILIENGSEVKAGDVLIELDTVLTAADVALLEKQHDYYVLDLARLYAERDGKPFIPPDDIGAPEVVQQQRGLFEKRNSEWQARIGVVEEQIRVTRAELSGAQNRYEKYKQIYPITIEQKKRVEPLAEDGTVSLFEFQNYVQREIEIKQDMLTVEEEVRRSHHAVQEHQKELQRIRSERDSSIAAQIVESRVKLDAIVEELVKAQEKHKLSRIVSPIDGVVQQLDVHTVGAVLTPAQPLMLIVPAGSPVEFEVWLENKDIGFVNTGQPAEIKVETFGFQRYGTLDAIVKTVATEAKEDPDRGLIYQVVLTSTRDYFIVGDKQVALLPGMAVTGEIKIRHKRVIQYFLDTFRTYTNEALREP